MDSAVATLDSSAELDPKRWLALAIIAVAQLVVVVDATIVNIALPSAQRALHISIVNRQWVITAYALTFGGFLLLGGRIADFVGRKKIFIIGLVGFAAASALGGVSLNGGMLFGARALQGAFGALMAPAALSLITVSFVEAKERATAFGVYGAIAGGGAAVGLLLGGILTQYASWRWCLLVNTPIAFVTALFAIPIVKESRAQGDTHYDIPGAIISTAALTSLVYSFVKADEDGWASVVTLGFILAGVVGLGLFVLLERRTEHPLLPLRIILDRNRGGSLLSSFLAGVGLFGMFLFLTYYLQGTLHYSPLKCGVAYLPFSGAFVVGAGIASKLLPRFGPRPLMAGGFFMGALGLALLTRIGVHTSFATYVLPPELLISIGLACAFVPLTSASLVGVEGHDAGVASAMVNTTQQVGGSLGTALLNTLAASATASYLAGRTGAAATHILPKALVHGYAVAFTFGAGTLVIAGIAVLALVHASSKEIAAVSPVPAVALD